MESAHAIAVQNVFARHRLVAAQKARISALNAAGLATNGHERLLEIMERRLRLLEEDERKLRLAVSLFNGPPPTIRTLKSEDEEINAVANWVVSQFEFCERKPAATQ